MSVISSLSKRGQYSTFQRLRSGSYGGYIIKPTDVVYRYDLGTGGCHYHGNTIPTSSIGGAGTNIVFGFDYFISTGTTIITDYLANFEGAASNAATNGGRTIGVWQRVDMTATINTSNPGVYPYLYPGACGGQRLAADGFILYKNPQVEALNYSSRFVYGPNGQFNTRNNGNVWRDLSGRGNDFTIQGNITWNKDTGFSNFNGNSVANGNKIFRSNFPQNTTGNTWHQDGSGDTLYVDGVQVNNDTYVMYNAGFHCYAATNANSGLLSNPTYPLTIGNEPNGAANPNAYPWVGDIAVVLMYERVLTASEIKQISNLYKDKYGY